MCGGGDGGGLLSCLLDDDGGALGRAKDGQRLEERTPKMLASASSSSAGASPIPPEQSKVK